MQQAFKLAFSMVLLYWLALWLNWDMPKYGALAIALISLDTTGASLSKGFMRVVGTTFGLGIGMLGLALFAQDSSLTLVYHVVYLAIVGYFMQASRYTYAWFVAGFLPSLVWATTYGKIEDAFSYATFRYLETTAGVVIYTAVSAMIWPHRAGDELNRQGNEFWQQVQELLGLYRCQLEQGSPSEDSPAKRAKLAGTVTQMLSTLEAAFADTPSVARRKPAWDSFRVASRAMVDAMEVSQQSITDCRHLDLQRLMPQIRSSLDQLDQRFARADQLWHARSAGGVVADIDDASLLDTQNLSFERDQVEGLSDFDRAALLNFANQLSLLHQISGDLLRTMRVLSGLSTANNLDPHTLPADLYQPSRWDGARFVSGLLPAFSLVVGWFFWIHFNPPTGPSIPNMAVTFGLMAVMTPMNMLRLIPFAMTAVCGIVAPIYFLVMPSLSTGPEILSLVFVFAFVARLVLVGRLTPLRSVTLPAFVMMCGISNSQTYSFVGIVSGAQMILLGLLIVSIVQVLVSPMKPELAMRRSIRRFFRGCAGVTGRYRSAGQADGGRQRRQRKRIFSSMILPASAKVRAEHKQLDFKRFPDNSPEKVQQLADAVQNITNRLRALEVSHQKLSAHPARLPESTTLLNDQLLESLQRVFTDWSTLEPSNAIEYHQTELKQIAVDFQLQFDSVKANHAQGKNSEQLLADLYVTLGSVRGLVDAMANAQVVLKQINWKQWATPRF